MDKHYDTLITELFARHPSVQNQGFTSGSYKPGLEGMRKFDEGLGNPWKNYHCIHVAGTNGKGSVCSMIAAGLAANGHKVGLYTSPHLLDFRERIKIIQGASFQMISRDYVQAFIEEHSLDGLSFFEITTAMAFSYFASQKVDYAVIETGLGGRLDSTNIITPVLSIITSIGLDHCALLGSTLEEIASEKAGIIKPGIPVLFGECSEGVASVFKQIAEEKGSLYEFVSESPLSDDTIQQFDIKGPKLRQNLALAQKALTILKSEPKLNVLAATARITGLHGRWEIIQSANPKIICDLGHNPAALKANFKKLREDGSPLFIVFGVMADKDYSTIRTLMPQNAKYYAVSPKSERALSVEKLAQELHGLDFICAPSVAIGVQMAIEAAAKVPNSTIYIGGSTFVVAEYLATLF